jgi:hypothetical protein
MRLRGRYPALLTGAVLTALMLSGCGSSAPRAKDEIAAIIRHEGNHPATLCDHLTDSLLARLGGRSGCLHQAASAASDPTTHATSIRVRGNAATALVVDRNGTRTIRLVRQRGVWKIAGVV